MQKFCPPAKPPFDKPAVVNSGGGVITCPRQYYPQICGMFSTLPLTFCAAHADNSYCAMAPTCRIHDTGPASTLLHSSHSSSTLLSSSSRRCSLTARSVTSPPTGTLALPWQHCWSTVDPAFSPTGSDSGQKMVSNCIFYESLFLFSMQTTTLSDGPLQYLHICQ